MNYLTDNNKTFILNQEDAETFFNVNARTLKRWRDNNNIKYKELVSGTYIYIIDAFFEENFDES